MSNSFAYLVDYVLLCINIQTKIQTKMQKLQRNMPKRCQKVDSKVLKNWRLKLYDTTLLEISANTGLAVNTIGSAFRTGFASPKTINAINEYFND